MDKIISELEEELLSIDNEIKSNYNLNEETLLLVSLFKKRVLIRDKISLLKWNNLSTSEKIKKRKDDIETSIKFYKKFPENKLLTKIEKHKAYVELVEEVSMVREQEPVYDLLYNYLNFEYFVNLDNLYMKHLVVNHCNDKIKKIYDKIISLS